MSGRGSARARRRRGLRDAVGPRRGGAGRRRRRARVGRARVRARGDRRAADRRCRRHWALQDPRRLARGAADGRARPRSRPPASTPTQVVGIATDFTASTPLPVLADGTPLCSAASSATARTPTRSCGSTTPRRRRRTASTRSPRSAASRGCPATAAASPPSGSSPRRCRCSRRTPRSTTRMDRWVEARRLDRLAAVRRGDAQRVHGRLQGDPPGRRAIRPRDYLRALNERFAGFVGGQARAARCRRWATAPAR